MIGVLPNQILSLAESYQYVNDKDCLPLKMHQTDMQAWGNFLGNENILYFNLDNGNMVIYIYLNIHQTIYT